MSAEAGYFLVFESGPKGGKTTLAAALAGTLGGKQLAREIVTGRSALTDSPFAAKVKECGISSLEYSTAFYWADLVFNTCDVIRPRRKAGSVVIYDRYDMSIVTYREAYGLKDDQLLADAYEERGMVFPPDLTVFLDPPTETMLERIARCQESSDIDRAFLADPQKLWFIQERMRHHLRRKGRPTLTLDTAQLSVAQCVDQIVARVEAALK